MLVGHFAIGVFGKRLDPQLSLGTLILASVLPDVLWCVFMLAGVEHVRFKPGLTIRPHMRALDALEASEIAYSHSLVMGGIWGGLFALAHLRRRRNPLGAGLLFVAVLSHWFLDVVSHPPDMSIAPGFKQRFGLGLWNSIPATLVIDGAFWALALVAFLPILRLKKRSRQFGFWTMFLLLTAVWYGNIAGPPPSDLSTIGISSLIFFSLTVGVTYALDQV